MSFNILQGGTEAKNVGFDNALFGGARYDKLAAVIKLAQADVVGVQEDCSGDELLKALGNGWYRVGSVYARFEMTELEVKPYLTVVEFQLTKEQRIRLVNCHWFPPAKGYGPELAQAELRADPQLKDVATMTKRVAEKCAIPNGPRGYIATVKPLKAAIKAKVPVILTGDFNEPSHLDWSDEYAKTGSDRWVKNPTGAPLRFAVRWPGSVTLADAGMIDSYRIIHSDPVKKPGNTWTPEYPERTPGRRAYGDQCLDRIDRIYHSGDSLEVCSAEVVGEKGEYADIVYADRWPSDHRGVVVTFRCD